jgi:putative peptidoglycan lipid II flippase
LYNVGIIIGIIFFYPLWGLKGVAFGVILGALMHLLIQIPGVIRLGFFPRPVAKLNFAEIRGVVKHSLPRTLGVSMDNVMMIFITAIASVMEVGSIAILNLSFSLQTVLLSVAGRSYSIAAFPTLAKYFVNNEKDKFVEHIATAGRQIVFWLIPFSALFIVLRAQIVRVLFGYGKFDWSDTRLTAAALALFVSSVTAQALIVLLARGYYAAGITKKPIVINICSSIVVIVLSFTFIKIFAVSSSFQFLFEKILRVEGLPGTSALTLALAYSIGMFLNAFLLIKFFKKDVVSGAKSLQKIWADLKKTILQVLWASILMGVVSYLSLNILDNWLNINTFVGIFLQGLVAGILGIIMWYVSLRFADNKELNEITSSFKQKFWKTPVVGPEAEELLQ